MSSLSLRIRSGLMCHWIAQQSKHFSDRQFLPDLNFTMPRALLQPITSLHQPSIILSLLFDCQAQKPTSHISIQRLCLRIICCDWALVISHLISWHVYGWCTEKDSCSMMRSVPVWVTDWNQGTRIMTTYSDRSLANTREWRSST